MGLSAGYGVLIGALLSYEPDDPNDYGDYMHGVLTVRGESDAGVYRCPVDVDTQAGAVPVHWRIQPLRIEEWAPLLELENGWFPLASNAESGAVDYIRDPRLRSIFFIPEPPRTKPKWDPFPPLWDIFNRLPHRRLLERTKGVRTVRRDIAAIRAPVLDTLDKNARPMAFSPQPVTTRALKGRFISYSTPWNVGSSAQALADLESVINGAERIIVFGEPFTYGGNGVHNIHQNQGDPVGGGHDDESGIWQDGMTIAIRSDGTASAFMNKFGTQSDQTDDEGRPV